MPLYNNLGSRNTQSRCEGIEKTITKFTWLLAPAPCSPRPQTPAQTPVQTPTQPPPKLLSRPLAHNNPKALALEPFLPKAPQHPNPTNNPHFKFASHVCIHEHTLSTHEKRSDGHASKSSETDVYVWRCSSSKGEVGGRKLRVLPVQAPRAPTVPPTACRLHFAERAGKVSAHPQIFHGPSTYAPCKMLRPFCGRQWRCQGAAGCHRVTL